MTILVIDTTTERGIIALGNEAGDVVLEKRLPAGFQNSDHLFPALEEIGLDAKVLTLILCAVGPGSYTGIRVGAVVAKTLSFIHKIPLVGVCSLEGFPAPALIDAKTGGAYILREGTWARLPLEEALEFVGKEMVHTPSATQLRIKAPQVHWVECYPSAEKLLRHGLSNVATASINGELTIHY